jgi:hypothetical protein
MWFGYPFESFDHINYISFLDDPYPFFFEPLYTIVAIAVANTIPSENRFFVVFFLFVNTPTLLVAFLSPWHGRSTPQYIYLWILLKSSYIGFISQRFWFAELWMTYFVLRYFKSWVRICAGFILTSGVHFGVLGVIPLWYFLSNGFNRLLVISAAMMMVGVVYFVSAGYTVFGYDYSRYVGMGDDRGFPYFSLFTLLFICWFARVSLRKSIWIRFVVAELVIFALKVQFFDLDVYSRIFQAQVDILLVYIAINGVGRYSFLAMPIFSLMFILGQSLVASTGQDVNFYIEAAFANAFENFLHNK